MGDIEITNPFDDTDEIKGQKGDILRHDRSGVEYVFYDVKRASVPNPTKEDPDRRQEIAYPVFLAEEQDGKLGGPYVVFDGLDVMTFVERGAPREPGERPVRNLVRPINPEKTTVTARTPGQI